MQAAVELRRARERVELTQAELARRAGTTQSSISAYEAGRKQPSLETLSRLLSAAGSRLIAVPGGSRVIRPSAARHARLGEVLLDVIALAEHLPTSHERGLRFPARPALAARHD